MHQEWLLYDTYLLSQIILKDNDEDYVYFVQSGRCKVIREVTAVKTKLPFGKSHLALVPLGRNPQLSKEQILEKRYLVLMTICHGGYFGVGEDLDQTWIISEGKVKYTRIEQRKNLFPLLSNSLFWEIMCLLILEIN